MHEEERAQSFANSSLVKSLGYRLVFFSILAIRPRVAGVHIPSLNHGRKPHSTTFQTDAYIQGFLFPWMREDNDPITEAFGRLVTTLDVIGLEAFVPEPPRGPGRPPEDRRALARAFVAKAVRGVPTTSALIDRNFRADHQAKAEWGREVERLKLIHMPDFDDLIYDFRTMAERVNARLKDELGARFLRVRGALKVKCHLMFGIVALAVDQIIRVVDDRTAPA